MNDIPSAKPTVGSLKVGDQILYRFTQYEIVSPPADYGHEHSLAILVKHSFHDCPGAPFMLYIDYTANCRALSGGVIGIDRPSWDGWASD